MHHYERKVLPHEVPSWVPDGAEFFITICCEPRGENHLCKADVAERVRSAFLSYQEQQKWWVHLLLLMPDHLHAIISFSHETPMRTSVAQWKRYLSRTCSVKWQRGFFDHRLRKADAFLEKAEYIRQNPVRTGLVENPDEWPYHWVFR